MIKIHFIEIFPLSRYQIGIEASLLMGIEIKNLSNLGFGFVLMLVIKTLKGLLKQI